MSEVGNVPVFKMIPSIFDARSRERDASEAETRHWSRALSGALIGFAGTVAALGGVTSNVARWQPDVRAPVKERRFSGGTDLDIMRAPMLGRTNNSGVGVVLSVIGWVSATIGIPTVILPSRPTPRPSSPPSATSPTRPPPRTAPAPTLPGRSQPGLRKPVS
jgi:hypothetical protein